MVLSGHEPGKIIYLNYSEKTVVEITEVLIVGKRQGLIIPLRHLECYLIFKFGI